MIDPGIWHSEQIGSISRDARLLFLGLVSNADDSGRLKASPRYLKATVFPYDEDIGPADVAHWLDEIARAVDGEGLAPAVLYQVGDAAYVQLTKWHTYQSIDRPSPSSLPPPFGEPQEPDPKTNGAPRRKRPILASEVT